MKRRKISPIPVPMRTPGQSTRARIVEALTRRIESGELAPGDRLPILETLSDEFGTSISNVHAALNVLAQQGLISRRAGVGSIVNRARRELRTVGLVAAEAAWCNSAFLRELANRLEARLKPAGLRFRLLLYPTPDEAVPMVQRAMEKGLIQGMITKGDAPETRRLNRLPLPRAGFSDRRSDRRVGFDPDFYAETALDEFAARGCRRIGVISSENLETEPERIGHGARLLHKLRAGAERRGMAVVDRFVRSLSPETAPRLGEEYSVFGYHAMREILAAPDFPDGILVFHDELLAGAVLAAAFAAPTPGRDFHLVFEANCELRQLAPLPCSFLEFSIDEVAAKAVELVLDQFHGRRPSARLLTGRVRRQDVIV